MHPYLKISVLVFVVLFHANHAQSASFRGLGFLPYVRHGSSATGVSADGSFVVGESIYKAFLWNENAGMVDLGDLPGGSLGCGAMSVSADGSSVVGRCVLEFTDYVVSAQAFHWLENRGMAGLDYLPGQVNDLSWAYAIAADGSVAVGRCGREACLWSKATGGEVTALFPRCPDGMHCGGIEGLFITTAFDVSANGTVVVGEHYRSNEGFYWGKAFRWTEQVGATFLDPLQSVPVTKHSF